MKDVLIVFKLLTSYRPFQWPEEIKIAGRYIWPDTERVWSTSQLISSRTTIVTKCRSRHRKCLKSLQKTVHEEYRAWKIFQTVIKHLYIYIYNTSSEHSHISILAKYFQPIVFHCVYFHLTSQGVRTHVHACILQDVYLKKKYWVSCSMASLSLRHTRRTPQRDSSPTTYS